MKIRSLNFAKDQNCLNFLALLANFLQRQFTNRVIGYRDRFLCIDKNKHSNNAKQCRIGVKIDQRLQNETV